MELILDEIIKTVDNFEFKIKKGDLLTINVIKDETVFSFDTEVIEVKNQILKLSKPFRVRQTDRRKYFRLNLPIIENEKIDKAKLVNVHAEMLISSSDENTNKIKPETITNISAGGFEAIISSPPPFINGLFKIKLDIPGAHKLIKTFGRIRRIKAWTDNNGTKKYKIGVGFIEIKEEDQDIILEFIHKISSTLK